MKVSSEGSTVLCPLQAEILLTVTAVTLQVEQAPGATPAVLLVKVQLGLTLKLAVKLIIVPSALMVTPVKVCVVVRPVTATEAVPSPVRFSVPVPGGLAKVTVTLAVKVSSPGAFVFWLLQGEMLLTEMPVILQTVPEQLAGAVPALLLVSVQAVAEKLAVSETAVPSAENVSPVKVWLVPLKVFVPALASPVRFKLPEAGGFA